MNRLVEILIILMVMVMMMIIDFAVWLTSKVVVALLLSGTIVESSYTFTPQYAAMSCFTRAKTGKDINNSGVLSHVSSGKKLGGLFSPITHKVSKFRF